MSKKILFVLFAGVLLIVMMALSHPLLVSDAQNQKKMDEKTDLSDVKKLPATENFHNVVKSRGTDWLLTATSYSPPTLSITGELPGEVGLVYHQNSKDQVELYVRQFASVEDARNAFLDISQGVIKKCAVNECGDEGRKLYRANGQLSSIEFRKGVYFVQVSGKSEENVTNFVQIFLQSLGG